MYRKTIVHTTLFEIEFEHQKSLFSIDITQILHELIIIYHIIYI